MSNYVVSARKYRPQRFEEVLGQEHITNTLKNALSKGQLAHAFLFSGPRGVGKTTCARILAKVINCQQPNEHFEPCGTCDSCQAFAKNASFNVFEMDGASNNKVEHIHQLLENVRVGPYTGKYKVFIIDEVHMLTSSAFNAFLKTLEEPPDYAIFILATTEKHKILPTILSRCQIYDFNRIQPDIIVEQLQQICEEEGIEAEEDALHLIGIKADGAMRDALSIFDRISSFTDKRIAYQDVIRSLHILDFEHFFKFTDAFLTENLPAVMLLLEEILDKGFDAHQVILGLSEHFRNLLMAKFPKTVELISVAGQWKTKMLEQSIKCSKGFLLSALDVLNQADVQYPRADNKRLHVEMALAKITFIHRRVKAGLLSPQEKKTQVNKKEDPPVKSASKSEEPSPTLPLDTPTPSSASTQSASQLTSKQQAPPIQAPVTPASPPHLLPNTGGLKKRVKKKTSIENEIPTLTTLDKLESMIKEHDEENGDKSKGMNLDQIRALWMDYAGRCSSPSIRQTLKQARLELDDKTIKVQLSKVLDKNTVLQETKLMDEIRAHYNDYDISLSINIVKEDTEEVPIKKPFLSDKEKYEKMVEQNPDLTTLIHRFDMRIVQE